MRKILFIFLSVGAVAVSCTRGPESSKLITQVDFTDVSIEDSFWSAQLKKHKDAVLPACIAQIEDSTGRMQNFINAGKRSGQHSGIFFDDSDVYKAIEGIAYSLAVNPDPDLESKADEWIGHIASAQLEDGYINTFYTLTGLDRRWTDMDRHEMYCAGHLIEAGVAYYKATGKRTLLDVGIRMADHMMTLFGPGKRDWVPGHEEIELALVKLYQQTGERKYLDFATEITDVYLSMLPEDMIPYWDFNDPEIPDVSKDASAAAVVASALIELSGYVDEDKGREYLDAAEKMLDSLYENYRGGDSCPAFLTHSTGHRPAGSEIDYAIIYADYYYIEALLRLKNLKK